MTETGLVTKTEGKYAYVKIDKKDECAKCGMCLFPKNASSIELRVFNGVKAKEGDLVLTTTSQKTKTVSSLLVFLVPLLLILIASAIGYFVFYNELLSLAFSVVAVVVWFIILSFIDKKLRKTTIFCSMIVKVLDNQATNQNEVD